jgi:Ran GTPase-activating protein (RanGAP) involved in mRNA processing and transport
MNRTEVLVASKEASVKEKRSFDKRPKKVIIINVHPEKTLHPVSESILDRNAHLNKALHSNLSTTGKIIEIDIDKSPPKVVIPPLAEYAVNPPSNESKKYFGLRAPKEFHEQVSWLKHRSEIADVSPIQHAMATQFHNNRQSHLSPPRDHNGHHHGGSHSLSPNLERKHGKQAHHSVEAPPLYLEDMHAKFMEKFHIHDNSHASKGHKSESHSSVDEEIFARQNRRGFDKPRDKEASVALKLDFNTPIKEAADDKKPINDITGETSTKKKSKKASFKSRKDMDSLRAVMNSQNMTIEEMMQMEPIPMTPRSRYIENCIRDNLNPRAFLILRKADTTELLLGHMGIGDKMGKAVADSFKDLPQVKLVDLSDNNFTDKALAPIIRALHANNSGITSLNISENSMGTKSSQALAELVRGDNCQLATLSVRCTDIHDAEAQTFLVPLKTNSTLTALDMSNNLLGVSETLNVVRKDVLTGGKALAQVLASPTCVLQTLKIGWNMIRVGSAVEFSRSLSQNNSLTHLDLNFNAIGGEGGIALGHSLLENKTLKSLYVSTNGLDAVACLTISAGAMENRTLSELILDGNPIHDQGAHGAMLVSVMGSNNLQISLQNCNIGSRDKHCDIDFVNNICRSYELSLNDPYQRAIAILLLRIVACHHTYLIGKCTYEERKGSKHHENLNLTQCWLNDKSATADAEAIGESRQLLRSGLQRLLDACSDKRAAKQFFDYVDTDHSGEIDRDEFGELLASIGIDLDNERLDATFDVYDLDRGGTIGITEFYVFLKREKPHAERRLLDLTHGPAFCTAKNPGVRYVPPARGVLHLTIVDGFQRKAIFKTLTGVDRKSIANAAGSPTDRAALILHAISGVKLRFDDALALYKSMAESAQSKVRVLSALLASISTPADAKALVSAAIGGSKSESIALKRSLGSAVKPLTGIFNGYYSLDCKYRKNISLSIVAV